MLKISANASLGKTVVHVYMIWYRVKCPWKLIHFITVLYLIQLPYFNDAKRSHVLIMTEEYWGKYGLHSWHIMEEPSFNAGNGLLPVRRHTITYVKDGLVYAGYWLRSSNSWVMKMPLCEMYCVEWLLRAEEPWQNSYMHQNYVERAYSAFLGY